MKRGLVLTMVMLAAIFATFSFILPGNSSALLSVTADGLTVWDNRDTGTTNDDKYWVQDLSLFINKTYDDQLATISALNIPGYTGFHLASMGEFNTLAPIGELNTNYFNRIVLSLFPPTTFSSFDDASILGRLSTTEASHEGSHDGREFHRSYFNGNDYSFTFLLSYPDSTANTTLSAWVVGSKVTPTPIPGALLLFGSGLLGLVGIGRKRFMK